MHSGALSLSVPQQKDGSVQLLVPALFFLCAIVLSFCASTVVFGFGDPSCCPVGALRAVIQGFFSVLVCHYLGTSMRVEKRSLFVALRKWTFNRYSRTLGNAKPTVIPVQLGRGSLLFPFFCFLLIKGNNC